MKLIEKYLISLNENDMTNKLYGQDVVTYITDKDISIGMLRFNYKPKGKCFLFILPNEKEATFHTKGMKFNIDIYFYDHQGDLDSKYLNVKPGISSIKSKGKIKYVIEVPSEEK